MNLIFTFFCVLSIGVLLVVNPSGVLLAINSGTQKAVDLSFKLMCVYCFWLGVLELIKSGGIRRLIAKIMKKPISFLFGKTSNECEDLLSLYLSSNFLGLSSAATPIGIKTQSLLDRQGSTYQQTMMFILACTPIQLVPTSIISLKAGLGSLSPTDVFLPILICSIISLALSISLVHVFYKR